jgi:hypothetical protein
MTSSATPRRLNAAGCAIWALVGVFVVGVGAFMLISSLSFGMGMPELRRPTAVLRGVADLGPAAPSVTIQADLRLDDGAVAAMHEGDGLVHLELDLESDVDLESLPVGVRWTSRAEVMRPVRPLSLDEDVRWTYTCETAVDCARTIGIDIELPDGVPTAEVSWRLVATVRPPREASVPEVAVVQLELVEESE